MWLIQRRLSRLNQNATYVFILRESVNHRCYWFTRSINVGIINPGSLWN